MNFDFVADFFLRLADLVASVEPWQQFAVLVLAGAVPFIESYLGSFLGVALGMEPSALVVAAAVAGNLICTFLLIALVGKVRSAATARQGSKDPGTRTVSARRRKVGRYLDRLGVPGVSLLGPVLVASQITGPTLVALGANRRSVFLWQGISIIAWGVLFGFFGDLVISWYM